MTVEAPGALLKAASHLDPLAHIPSSPMSSASENSRSLTFLSTVSRGPSSWVKKETVDPSRTRVTFRSQGTKIQEDPHRTNGRVVHWRQKGGKKEIHSPLAYWMEGNRRSSGDWRALCGSGDD